MFSADRRRGSWRDSTQAVYVNCPVLSKRRYIHCSDKKKRPCCVWETLEPMDTQPLIVTPLACPETSGTDYGASVGIAVSTFAGKRDHYLVAPLILARCISKIRSERIQWKCDFSAFLNRHNVSEYIYINVIRANRSYRWWLS
jgi:hypothetical protein